jgi:hypothetical protein
MIFEGATDGANETTISAEDPGADLIYQLTNLGAAGTYDLLSIGIDPGAAGELPVNDHGRAIRSKNPEKVYFREAPVFASAAPAATTGAFAACSTTGNPNYLFQVGSRYTFELDAKGTVTACGPDWAVGDGMGIHTDAAANEGHELTLGITAASPAAYVIGTDPAFYARMNFDVATVANSDQIYFGFRLAEGYQDANITAYDSVCAMGIGDLADGGAGDTYEYTEEDGTGHVLTDTTEANWADGETHYIEVRISAAGACTLFYDGNPAGGAIAMGFDAAETVIPFLWVLSDVTGADPDVDVVYFEHGIQ